MKKKHIIFGSLGVVVLSWGSYYLFKKFSKPKSDSPEPSYTKMPKVSVCKDNASFPLKKTSNFICAYDNVRELQKTLNRKRPTPILPIKVDGKFGKNTLKMLQEVFNISEVTEEFYLKEILPAKSIDDMIYGDLKGIISYTS